LFDLLGGIPRQGGLLCIDDRADDLAVLVLYRVPHLDGLVVEYGEGQLVGGIPLGAIFYGHLGRVAVELLRCVPEPRIARAHEGAMVGAQYLAGEPGYVRVGNPDGAQVYLNLG